MVSNFTKNNSKESLFSLLKWLYSYISKKNKFKLFKLIILMITCGFSEVLAISSVIPFLNMLSDPEMVDNYIFLKNIMSFSSYYRPIVISGCFLILVNIINLFLRLLNIKKINTVTSQLGNELSCKVFSHTINQPYNFHLHISSSLIINAVTSDLQRLIAVLNAVNQLITGFIISSFIVITLLIIDFRVAFISFIVFSCTYFFVGKRVNKKLVRNSFQISKALLINLT